MPQIRHPNLFFPRNCFESAAQTAVQPTPVRTSNAGVLAKRSSTGFSQASRARPTRPETRCLARLDKFCVVNFIHYLFPPLVG
jgi:hypothetical protein